MKIKKGDNVWIAAGRDKGKRGKVLRVFPKAGRIQIEGVNIRKKHTRPQRAGQKGQTVQVFSPLPISNARFLCPKCARPARVGARREGKKKVRICIRCKSEV